MKCAFTKISTKNTFTPVWEFGTELYGRFLYLEKGEEQCLICAFDFGGTFPKEATRFRNELSQLTGIPAKSIWYHELQIHAAPFCESLCGEAMDKLIQISANAVNDMVSKAVECDCYAANIDMGTDYSFNREQYVHGLGGVTVWRGIKFDENGNAYTQDPSIMLLRGYKPQLEVFDKPIYFDNTVDQMAYMFMFKDKQGNVLGTVSRFSAHPDVAVLFEHSENKDIKKEYRYNFDWPGYLSEDMEKEFGGIGMYINGPCADLATKKDCVDKCTYEAAAAECKRLAKLIGDKIRKEFKSKAEKINADDVLKTETFEIFVPIKEDIPYSYEEMINAQDRINKVNEEYEKAVAENKSPAEIKKIIDDVWRAGHLPYMFHNKEYNFSDEEYKTHQALVTVSALRFGGYLFVGVPGESLVDMSIWLRSRFTGVKTIPVDQVNGYYHYMATPRSMTLGGYTYWSSWVARDGIPVLKSKLAPMLDEFVK